jgi:hypothetical protein
VPLALRSPAAVPGRCLWAEEAVLLPPYTETARSTLPHAVCGRGPVEERGPVAGVLVAACTQGWCEWSLFGGEARPGTSC